LERGDLRPHLLPTSQPGQATAMAREAASQGADLVLVFGGDGTVNEVVQGLAFSGVPLGVLPGGTANVLARELRLPLRPDRAVEQVISWESHSIALGKVTGPGTGSRYFLLMCGAGLDASVVYQVHAGLKAAAGKLAYWAAGFRQLARSLVQLDVCVDGAVYQCGFALVSRVRNYGGDLEIATGASLLRDDFEVVLFEGTHTVRYIWYMFGVALRRTRKLDGVRMFRAHRVDVLSKAPLQIDGEYLGEDTVAVEIVPNAINLLLPPGHG
jgi:diacylglycerol kinase (ATP)